MICNNDRNYFVDINYKNGNSFQSAIPLYNEEQMIDRLIGKKPQSGSFAAYYDENHRLSLAFVRQNGSIDDTIKCRITKLGKVKILSVQDPSLQKITFKNIQDIVNSKLGVGNVDERVDALTENIKDLTLSESNSKKTLRFSAETSEITYSTTQSPRQMDITSFAQKSTKDDRGLSPRQSKALVFTLPKGRTSEEIKKLRTLRKINKIQLLTEKTNKLQIMLKDIQSTQCKFSVVPNDLLKEENKIMRKMLCLMDQIVALHTYG